MTTTFDHRPAPTLTPWARTGAQPTSWERKADRHDRRRHALRELFVARSDLGGVSQVADVLAEDLLWSV